MRLSHALPLLVCLVPSLLAHADTFTLTGDGDTISFSLPHSPEPYDVRSNCPSQYEGEFCMYGEAITIDDGTYAGSFEFFDSDTDGGLNIYTADFEYNILDQLGPQLFTGSIFNPTFTPGTYHLTNDPDNFNYPVFGQDFTLTIAGDVPITSTPEPSSLLLLGSGLLCATAVLRRKATR